MTNNHVLALLVVVVVVALSRPAKADVKFEFIDKTGNIPGCNRFQTEIGVFYTKQTLRAVTHNIWCAFNESETTQKKDYHQVALIVESFGPQVNPNTYVSRTNGSTIYINADHIQNYSGEARVEFTGIMIHESTRIWQWTGDGRAPVGLLTGIADYMRMSQWMVPPEWVKRGSGSRWDEGYAVTAYFLNYCSGPKNGAFVSKLNGLMKERYSDSFFEQLLGKSVGELWIAYKSEGRNSPEK